MTNDQHPASMGSKCLSRDNFLSRRSSHTSWASSAQVQVARYDAKRDTLAESVTFSCAKGARFIARYPFARCRFHLSFACTACCSVGQERQSRQSTSSSEWPLRPENSHVGSVPNTVTIVNAGFTATPPPDSGSSSHPWSCLSPARCSSFGTS